MKKPVLVTLEVTQDCIDSATLTPTNCPVARAAANAGLTGVHVGNSAITANDDSGRPMHAPVSIAMFQVIRHFDTGGVIVPSTFHDVFQP